MTPDNLKGDKRFPDNLLPHQLCLILRKIFAEEILQSLLNLEMIAFLQEENQDLDYNSPERNVRNGFSSRDVRFVRQELNEEYLITLNRPRDRKGRFKSIILQTYHKKLHFKMESLIIDLEKYQEGNKKLADKVHLTLSQVFGYRFTEDHICYIADQLLSCADDLNTQIKVIVEKAQKLTEFSLEDIGRFFKANVKLAGKNSKRKPGRIKIGYYCSQYGKSKKEALQTLAKASTEKERETYSHISKLKRRGYRDEYEDYDDYED